MVVGCSVMSRFVAVFHVVCCLWSVDMGKRQKQFQMTGEVVAV